MTNKLLEETKLRAADAMQGFLVNQPPDVYLERFIQSLVSVVSENVRRLADKHVHAVNHDGIPHLEVAPQLQALLLTICYPTMQNYLTTVDDALYTQGLKTTSSAGGQCAFVDDKYAETPRQRQAPNAPEPTPELYVRPAKRPSSMIPWQK